MMDNKFWEHKTLHELTKEEWEALCDGCAKCCLHKLQDEDTLEYFYTNVTCRMLDPYLCRCTSYENRNQVEPGCVILIPDHATTLEWLPVTCAYRRIAHGLPLEPWHPLISGDPESVHRDGISIRGKTIREQDIDIKDLEDYIVNWIK
jgi:uncharacterized cysteine cluster protein YcgN (CxxCxxCC family)